MLEIRGKVNTAICFARVVEDEAIEQIRRMCDTEMTRGSRIRIMPDVHAGKGCTIGTTMMIVDSVVPNMVGVDIGCGMYVEELGTQDIDPREFDRVVHKIPAGFKSWQKPIQDAPFMRGLFCYKDIKSSVIDQQVGTLGGGNHFIELDKDEGIGKTYLVIHSGSRNIGKQVADFYQKLAERTCTADVPRPLKYLTG